jgi:hypothetical protein
MDSNSKSKSIRSWLLTLVLLTAIIGLFVAIAVPNFVGGGPSKLSSIINVLRQIDGAKEYWAEQHGFTNSVNSSREITQQDIAPYLKHGSIDKFGFGFDQNGYVHAGKGIIYSINSLGKSPEAKFTSDFRERSWPHGWKIPNGTVVIFSGMYEKYILPGQESKPPKSLSEVFANN